MVTLIWHTGKYKVHKLHQRYILEIYLKKIKIEKEGKAVPAEEQLPVQLSTVGPTHRRQYLQHIHTHMVTVRMRR